MTSSSAACHLAGPLFPRRLYCGISSADDQSLECPAQRRRHGRDRAGLGYTDGERVLTNLQHLSELLHAADTTEQLGLDGLIRWATLARQEARREETSVEDGLELRLETERNALEIVTVHKSKGLEYPFVYAPYLGRTGGSTKPWARSVQTSKTPPSG